MESEPIQLLPTDLIAVEVPINSERYLFSLLGNMYLTYDVGSSRFEINLGSNEDFEILGEVTANSILTALDDYIRQDLKLDFDEFLNLLKANGLHWVNPIEKPNIDKFKDLDDRTESFDKFEKWQDTVKRFDEAESKVIKGKLIILKQVK
jgi:hypothetical protein